MIRSIERLSTRFIVTTIGLLALAALVACGGATATDPGATGAESPAAATTGDGPAPTAVPASADTAPQAADRGIHGGIVPMHDYAFPNLIFHPHEFSNQFKNISAIYNGLIEYNAETDDPYDIRGDLAESWELLPDGVTYVFRLHDNATWHDGTAVTADDVVWSMDSLVNTAESRPQTLIIAPYFDAGNARAIDAHTVEVKTNNPAPDFIPMLAADAFKMMSKNWDQQGFDTAKWENGMGSGPFLPTQLAKDVSMELERNPNYWKEGLPYIDGIIHYYIADKGTAIGSYRTGQVLMTTFPVTNLSNTEILELQEAEADILDVYLIPNTSLLGTLINTTIEPFNDVRVRRALHLAVDRTEFRSIFGGGIAPVGTPLPPDTWFGRTEEEALQLPGYRSGPDGGKHPDDIAEAKRLLAEAGVPDGFEVNIMARTAVEYVDLAQLLADQLRRHLDWDATVQPIDSATGLTRYKEHDYQIGAQGTALLLGEPDPIIGKIFMPGGLWIQWSGWEAPEQFQDWFAAQSRELDRTKRAAILREMEDWMLTVDPGPLLVYYWSFRDQIVNKQIKNYHMPVSLWVQLKHEHIWCDPAC
jgi:peptide/nickel transport system substrate-binding protein